MTTWFSTGENRLPTTNEDMSDEDKRHFYTIMVRDDDACVRRHDEVVAPTQVTHENVRKRSNSVASGNKNKRQKTDAM